MAPFYYYTFPLSLSLSLATGHPLQLLLAAVAILPGYAARRAKLFPFPVRISTPRGSCACLSICLARFVMIHIQGSERRRSIERELCIAREKERERRSFLRPGNAAHISRIILMIPREWEVVGRWGCRAAFLLLARFYCGREKDQNKMSCSRSINTILLFLHLWRYHTRVCLTNMAFFSFDICSRYILSCSLRTHTHVVTYRRTLFQIFH